MEQMSDHFYTYQKYGVSKTSHEARKPKKMKHNASTMWNEKRKTKVNNKVEAIKPYGTAS
jgi:hypothetical protein